MLVRLASRARSTNQAIAAITRMASPAMLTVSDSATPLARWPMVGDCMRTTPFSDAYTPPKNPRKPTSAATTPQNRTPLMPPSMFGTGPEEPNNCTARHPASPMTTAASTSIGAWNGPIWAKNVILSPCSVQAMENSPGTQASAQGSSM